MFNSQMVERPWGVTVYGAANVKAMPDLVRARFKVSRIEQTPSESFAAASEAVAAIRQALRSHGVSDAAVERSQLGLRSSWTYGSERQFLGYECEAAFAVESVDLDDVQSLLVDLVAAGANQIDAVDFDVTGKGELRAEARRQAVAAARRKAELYAEAASVRLGAVLHIEDVDPEKVGNERYRGHGSGGDASAQDLAPGHVVVSAAVILGFSINRE
ncbi:SIMPL domain-containing protein [Lentzea sp. NPDC054927]